MKKLHPLVFLVLVLVHTTSAQTDATYAEKLGYPKGAKVLILHVDDVGMSWDSNQGAIKALEQGVATSLSIMMPCPWVPGIAHYLKEHPGTDAGLHLTLTSEWRDYRWGPLSGKPATPGLVDGEGAMWAGVADVVQHATPDEVATEIQAQIDRARTLGFEPTHLDSHMGTLFATPAFLEKYMQAGIKNKIAVMLPGGHNTLIARTMPGSEALVRNMQALGANLWNAGLPVLDDLHNFSYGFKYAEGLDDSQLQQVATEQYIKSLKDLQPGLTMVIMHCTVTSEVFPFISDSGSIRKGDLLTMLNPEFKAYLQQEGIILTTWREAAERRKKVK